MNLPGMHHGSTLRSFLLFALLLCLLAPLGLAAQRPTPIQLPKGTVLTPGLGLKMDCESDAGEVNRFTGFAMQSNSFGENIAMGAIVPFNSRPDTIFLCADDLFRVSLRNGSTNLTGDPNTATTPGAGYAFYRCDPTVTGPTLADIVADPCVADNGLSPFDDLAIGVPPNYAIGDYSLTIANDEVAGFTIPALFAVGGAPQPVVLTLAPITFDHVNPVTFQAIYEGNPIGECVNVATDQRFAVAYLNPVTVGQIDNNPAGCDGLFDVFGGTPELRGGTGYTISIVNEATGEFASLLTPRSEIGHSSIVRYRVPSNGTYRITIEDENSCGLAGGSGITVTHNNAIDCALPVVFNLPIDAGLPGQNICVPVTVENYSAITAFEMTILFDENVLAFTGVQGFNPNLAAGISANGPVSSGGTLPNGNVRFIYFDLGNTPVSIPDGETVFEICFDIVGVLGDRSPLVEVAPEAEFTRDPQVTGRPVINAGEIVVTNQAFLLELTRQNEACDGFNDGRITAEASGAPGPFTFSIRRTFPGPPEVNFRDARTGTGVPSMTTFNGLVDGEYEVRAVSADGQEVISMITVEAGLGLTVSMDVSDQPTCFGDTDGTVRALVAVNGVALVNPVAAGYTFSWGDDPTATGDVRINVGAGQYSVTVTAPNGRCQNDARNGLNQPAEVQVRPDNRPDAVESATCSGTPDGSITVSADGGLGPYDFQWPTGLGVDNNAPGDSSLRNNLIPAAYQVVVTDAMGCTDTANFVVDALKTLFIVSEVDSIACFGDANAVIRVNGSATGAAPVGNYEVNLLNLNNSTTSGFQEITNNSIPFEFDNLSPARYVVVLRDQDPAGCTTTDTFDIGQPELLEIDENIVITNETCTVGMDGSAVAAVTGGRTPYEYRWVNDSLDMAIDTITPGSSLTGLSADTNYVLIVTDANGCLDSLRFRINAPAGANLSVVDTSFISCPGDNDGRLSVVATPPPGATITSITWYSVNADGTLGSPVATGLQTQANLSVGRYAVEVITSNSCSAFQEGFVVSPGEVFLREPALVNNPQCPGDANGSIFLNPGGGTPNADGTYNYVWSTDPFGAPTTNLAFTNLRAGDYTVTITDGNGCQPPFVASFTLVDPPAITTTFTNTPVSCPDDLTMDGTATVVAGFSDGSSGTFDFIFTVTNNTTTGATQATETGLARGPVTVRVTDGVCSESFTDTIRSPEEFVVDVVTTSVSCNGASDGAARVDISGGTPGYDYTWSNATDIDSIIDGLVAGMGFVVDITDARGCTPGPQLFNIAQPDPLTLSVDPVQTTETVRCAGDMNGRIGIFISSVNNNDLAANPYNWSPNVAGSNETLATGLSPGTYRVTVTDVEGCQDSLAYTIGEPEAIIFSVLPIEEPLCFGETTPILVDTAFGGTSNGIQDFTFSVNNDGFRIPVGQNGSAFAGDIVVTVFDSVGCSASQTFSINQPPQIIIDLPEEIVVELGDSLTRLNPLVSPAGDIYSYRWSPAEFLSADSVRNPLIFPFESRDYVLQVTNANDCQAFADIFVEVDANRNVYIPNVFSPNRDGRNEDFRIFACQGVRRVNNVAIYDRWGGLLFNQGNFDPNCLDGIQLWDGLGQNGKPVNPGVFVYVIEVEFLDNRKLVYRGDVTVLR